MYFAEIKAVYRKCRELNEWQIVASFPGSRVCRLLTAIVLVGPKMLHEGQNRVPGST